MPVTNTMPSAESGFIKLKKLLRPEWKAVDYYTNDMDIAAFKIYPKGFFWFLKGSIANVKVYDTGVYVDVIDNSSLPELEDMARKFERVDERQVKIKVWE